MLCLHLVAPGYLVPRPRMGCFQMCIIVDRESWDSDRSFLFQVSATALSNCLSKANFDIWHFTVQIMTLFRMDAQSSILYYQTKWPHTKSNFKTTNVSAQPWGWQQWNSYWNVASKRTIKSYPQPPPPLMNGLSLLPAWHVTCVGKCIGVCEAWGAKTFCPALFISMHHALKPLEMIYYCLYDIQTAKYNSPNFPCTYSVWVNTN